VVRLNGKRLRGRRQVCVPEVESLEQERFSGRLREGVGEAVAKVQPRGMTAASPEVSECRAADARLFGGHRLDDNSRNFYQLVQPSAGHRITAGVYDDGDLQEVRGG
jgi:hypothetical protein